MKLIHAEALLSWKVPKESRDIEREEYIDLPPDGEGMAANKYICCVSHRWINIDHPDPSGTQLLELQNRLRELHKNGMQLHDVLVFFDYACMIQRPRTKEEQTIFEQDIANLDQLFLNANKVIVLSEGYTDYKNRAWCFLELILSEKKVFLFNDQEEIKADLKFRQSLFGHLKSRMLITELDISSRYILDWAEMEVLAATYQHLLACKLSHKSDYPLIKQQMTNFFNKRRLSPSGKLLVGLCKYSDVSVVLLDSTQTHDIEPVVCWPYFKESDWIRLQSYVNPRLGEIRVDILKTELGNEYEEAKELIGNTPQHSLFALSPGEYQNMNKAKEANKNCKFFFTWRLSMPGVEDHRKFLTSFQTASDWDKYVVSAFGLTEKRQDCFPSIDHVIHTLLESKICMGPLAFQDCFYLIFVPPN